MTLREYLLKEAAISGAVAEIKGRYPEKEFVVNEESKELVYVLSGKGKITSDHEALEFTQGDVILVQPREKYYWEGNFELFVVNTPAFDPKQHKFCHRGE